MSMKNYVEKESVLCALKNNYMLLLIFLAGLTLRIYDLGTESIWFDEAISIMVSKLGIIEQIKWNIAVNESNPPFYYLLLHYWIPYFGDSEFISRLPSAILGSVSILAIYAVGKLLFNKKAGLIAALILATSVFHIKYSQEARGYTLMVFLSLVSLYSLLKLTSGRRRVYSVAYIVSSVFLMYTHYYGSLIIIAQNVFCFTLFLKNKKAGELSLWRWVKLQAVLGLLFLPGFLLWAKVTFSIQKGFWVPEPQPGWILGFFTIYSGSLYLLILFTVFSFLSVIGFGKINRAWKVKEFFRPLNDYPNNLGITSGNLIYLLLLWLLIPVMVPYIISLASSPVLIFRYTICASLAFYLLASKGISNTDNKWLIVFISAVIVVLSMVSIEKYYSGVDKHQWREVMSDIETNAGYGDVIVVYPHYEKQPAYYYSKRKDLKIIPMKDKFPSFNRLGDRNIWFVVHAHPVNRRLLKSGLRGRYDFVSEKYYNRLDLFRLKEKRK
ncbi:MAG: glycosyltransferase family 39 protein [Deltaproteobacteria bacterium]